MTADFTIGIYNIRVSHIALYIAKYSKSYIAIYTAQCDYAVTKLSMSQ